MAKKEKPRTPTEAEMQTYVDAGYTVADIATTEGWSVSKVRYWLKKFGLKASTENKSIGHKSFRTLIQQEFPAYPIKEEHHIGNRLMLDFYIPGIHVAFEIDGRQHEEINNLYHSGSSDELQKARMRDAEKEQRCRDSGILLIRIPAATVETAVRNEEILEHLFSGIRDKIAAHEPPEKKPKVRHSPDKFRKYREKMKELSKEARKRQYRQAKEIQKRRKHKDRNSKKTAFGG